VESNTGVTAEGGEARHEEDGVAEEDDYRQRERGTHLGRAQHPP
jgi:hypothetical protein